MAAVQYFNRVKFTTATTGTGTITVGSAVANFRTPADASIPDGTTVSYMIEEGAAWETGHGVTGSSGTTLTRGVLQSSASNALITLAGAATVRLTYLAEDTGITWKLDYSDALTTTTNITTSAGTWTTNGGQVQCTAPGGAGGRARANTATTAILATISEVEVEIPATFNSTMQIGVSIIPTASPGLYGVVFRLTPSKVGIDLDNNAVLGETSYTPPAAGTWEKVRLLAMGSAYSGWLNGAKVIEAVDTSYRSGSTAYYSGLWAFNSVVVRYRNFKSWSLILNQP
jgi:hypothetical protein